MDIDRTTASKVVAKNLKAMHAARQVYIKNTSTEKI